ncbi:DUF805 domain-containing protein [Acinetobacter sp. WCHAc060033]|uniref:DUF805 domain-containing protein n=1 Tax=Acinetobacter sp. WCHAc060033 TaxID=2518624 RepID=UPI001022ABBB|nr:DUF805 domain-containing protein [Acinetobacter sp. WCHAc060033]RZG88697.1 DUF805 domain-containing protein [Acinetobacter sp. WCHAc060033]
MFSLKTTLNKFSTPLSNNSHQPFNFSGRFGRLSYIAWTMLLSISTITLDIYLSFKLFNIQIGENEAPTPPSLLEAFLIFVLFIFTLYTFFIFTIRRLHDLNRSGWFSILLLVPVIQIFLFCYLLLFNGSRQSNSYGEPRTTPTWEKVIALLSIICIPLLVIFCVYVLHISPPNQPIIEFEGSQSVVSQHR